jgi:GTP-binding protein EngB required for normal cell division
LAIQEILLDFLEEKKDIKGFINIIDMSADKEKSKTNQKKIVWIFWAFMAIAIFVILNW